MCTLGYVCVYQAAYDCDVTYVSNQELGFDFLRDNLAMSVENVVQQTRPFRFCLVDEVDSILIDEARTPLIISRKGKLPNEKHISAAQIARELTKDVHYEVDLKNQKVELTQVGFKFCEQVSWLVIVMLRYVAIDSCVPSRCLHCLPCMSFFSHTYIYTYVHINT